MPNPHSVSKLQIKIFVCYHLFFPNAIPQIGRVQRHVKTLHLVRTDHNWHRERQGQRGIADSAGSNVSRGYRLPPELQIVFRFHVRRVPAVRGVYFVVYAAFLVSVQGERQDGHVVDRVDV